MTDKPIALAEWLEAGKELCNPKDIVPFGLKESLRRRAIESSFPQALRIIEALIEGVRHQGLTENDAREIAEMILNERDEP
jgi:hypothetical protein